jgi:hypothetical protein
MKRVPWELERSDWLPPKKKNRSGEARPVDQRPGAAGALHEPEASERKWSQGGNHRSKENEERGNEQPEVLASS